MPKQSVLEIATSPSWLLAMTPFTVKLRPSLRPTELSLQTPPDPPRQLSQLCVIGREARQQLRLLSDERLRDIRRGLRQLFAPCGQNGLLPKTLDGSWLRFHCGYPAAQVGVQRLGRLG